MQSPKRPRRSPAVAEVPAAGDDPVRTILDAIRDLIHALRDFSLDAEQCARISGAQLFALQVIARKGPLSVNELAAATLTHQSSVSVVARKLVDQKLAVRRASAADRRRVELTVTARGRALLAKAPAPAQDRLIDAILAFPEVQRTELSRLLLALTTRMGASTAAPPMFFERSTPPRPAAKNAAARKSPERPSTTHAL